MSSKIKMMDEKGNHTIDYFKQEVNRMFDKVDRYLKSKNKKIDNLKLIDLLKFFYNSGLKIDQIDSYGDWAEINDSKDISKFILGSKSETLIRLKNILRESKILDQVKFKSEKTFKALNRLKEKYPKYIKTIKGKGLFIGIEFDFDNIISNFTFKKIKIPFIKSIKTVLMGSLIREFLHEHKVLLHFTNAQPETLVFLPPLIISDREIDVFIESIDKVLEKGLMKLFTKFIYENVKFSK